jgi:cytochrome b6-f complex iron-sulfur subunit
MKKREDQQSRPKQEQQQKAALSKSEANKKLDYFQRYIGSALIASAAFGIYLLATDKSLWLLAVSHAYGLLAICAIDIVLGGANLLLSSRKVILPSYGWAILTILLQLGDIGTAPQYKMTPEYFASYLFHLWAYDGLLLVQGAIIVIGLSARRYQKIVVRKKHLTYFDMGFKKSRRDFLQITGAIGALLAITAALGAWAALSTSPITLPPNNGGTSSQTSNLPSGAIANTKDLQVNTPVYFEYPSSGYPNMLLKKADGSMEALSMLCTHTCCQCQYDSSTTDIYCPCHGSIFDQNGSVLRGPAPTNLPSIQLSIDSNGNIFPVKVVGSSPCGLG